MNSRLGSPGSGEGCVRIQSNNLQTRLQMLDYFVEEIAPAETR